MPERERRRTALLIDVTTFGGAGTGFSDRPLNSFTSLPFHGEVNDLAAAFKRVDYEVTRLKDPTADRLAAEIRRVVADHGPDDVVAVHIMSHGFLGKKLDSLYICGTDSTADGPAVDMTELLRDFIVLEDGPYILFSLDLCHAGKAAEIDHAVRVGQPDKVWVIGATTSDAAAFDARFTAALSDTLNRIRAGLSTVVAGPPYVPYTDFATAVDKELQEIVKRKPARTPQTAIGTLIQAAQNVSDLPFFDNYKGRDKPPALAEVPAELAYFAAAANVRFTGRAAEVDTLAGWLRGDEPAGPRLVTGRPGTGKSALLGALVCAAHPWLTALDPPIPQRVAAAPRVEMMAAIPARHRDVAGFVSMISAQLFHTNNIHTTQGIVNELRRRREQDEESPTPVIVVDSLDEAAAPVQVFNLLRTLCEIPEAQGGPLCKVVIASRSTSEVTRIIRAAATGVLDLDEVDPRKLREDVETYARTLLSDATDYLGRSDVSGALAGAVARTLVTADRRPAWGEFLVTRLYLRHLLESRAAETDTVRAIALGNAVPLDPAEVLELGLAAHSGEVWARPTLAALALVHGLGAPVSVINNLAGVCRGRPGLRPGPEKLAEVLESLGSYLRVLPAPDGEERYQLFHDGLADHLRDHPTSHTEQNPVTAEKVCAALFGGVRSWTDVDGYVVRHALYHAQGTALLPKLLRDPDFLLCGRSEAVLAVAEVAEDQPVGDLRKLARAAHEVMVENGRTPGDRERLAVVAARAGDPDLAQAISVGAYRPVLVLDLPLPPTTPTTPILLSGSDSSSIVQIYNPVSEYRRVFQVRHPHPVVSLCASTVNGDELVTGDIKGTARVWPLVEGSIPRLTRAGHVGAVRALATIERDGEPPRFLSADDKTLRLWNSEDGDWVRTIQAPAGRVSGLSPFSTAGRRDARVLVQSAMRDFVFNMTTLALEPIPGTDGVTTLCPAPTGVSVLAFGKQGTVSSTDLTTFQQERWLPSADGQVTAAVHVAGLREPAVVSGDSSGRLTLWHLATRSRSDLGAVNGEVTALTSFVSNGRPVVVCAAADGTVSVWDPEECLFRTSFTVSSHISALAHDWSPAAGEHRAVPLVRCGWGFGGVVIAMVDKDNTVQIHSSTGSPQTLGPFDRAIAGVSVVPGDGWATVVVENDRGLAMAWNPVNGKKLPAAMAVDTGHTTHQTDQNVLLVRDQFVRPERGDDGTVRLVPLAGQDVIEFPAHAGRLTALEAWGHNGSARAATSGEDRRLCVWDLGTQELQYEMNLNDPATNITAVHGDHLVVQTGDEIIVLSQRECA